MFGQSMFVLFAVKSENLDIHSFVYSLCLFLFSPMLQWHVFHGLEKETILCQNKKTNNTGCWRHKICQSCIVGIDFIPEELPWAPPYNNKLAAELTETVYVG